MDVPLLGRPARVVTVSINGNRTDLQAQNLASPLDVIPHLMAGCQATGQKFLEENPAAAAQFEVVCAGFAQTLQMMVMAGIPQSRIQPANGPLPRASAEEMHRALKGR